MSKSPKMSGSRERVLPLCQVFAPGALQATRLHSHNTLQRISRRLGNSSDPGDSGDLKLLREEDLSDGIPKIVTQGDDHSRRLIRIGSREDAFLDSLLDDLREPGHDTFDIGQV